jgi:hypothetical protein
MMQHARLVPVCDGVVVMGLGFRRGGRGPEMMSSAANQQADCKGSVTRDA